ncbi:flavodoxin domain-containing protein [Dyadobacter psychrotolerans]|nr:flavodoxin domain-containing protein [Dyadobacter psychrotolerans]
MRGIVLFKGKYGATAQYANWIGEKLDAPVVEAPALSSLLLQEYDYLVVGSSVYMGKFVLADWLKKNGDLFKDRKLFLFVVGATASTDKVTQDRIISKNIPKAILANCSIYFLPGRLDLKTLNWSDNLLVKFAGRFEKNTLRKNVLLNGIDEVKQENISDLIKEVEAFAKIDKLV